jgi:serine/threonine-protein kinase HipA
VNRCPITYDPLGVAAAGTYSPRGLRLLSRTLERLEDLGYSAEEQRIEAVARATKMSIQGVQPKLSAKLLVREGRFEVVDRGGEYILKPQNDLYRSLPENEDLTMRLAAAAGVEVPVHGLVRSRDGSWTYFIRRFDRIARSRKLAVEDFAQLSGRTRDTKYESSMEQVATILERHATFPAVEKLELFVRTAFSFLTGNEDMHLKNFSVIVREGRVQLSPAYDLVNSTIALPGATEELALPLRGKKRRLRREDLVEYFGRERLGLAPGAIEDAMARLARSLPEWHRLVEASFLPENLREAYVSILRERSVRLGLASP